MLCSTIEMMVEPERRDDKWTNVSETKDGIFGIELCGVNLPIVRPMELISYGSACSPPWSRLDQHRQHHRQF